MVDFLEDFSLELGGLLVEGLLDLGVFLVEVLLGLLHDDELAHVVSVLLSEVLEGVCAHLTHVIE